MKILGLVLALIGLAFRTKLVQRYQAEFGQAVIKELQRNQERSRRGSTPLNPSLANGVNDAKGHANNVSAQAQANAEYNARNDAQWRADNAYNGSVAHANNVHAAANGYTNQQVGAVQPYMCPPGLRALWPNGSPLPGGWGDTGKTVTGSGTTTWQVIYKY